MTQPENGLKLAIRPLGGKINDLSWDGESKRIIVGGEGKDKYGAAFFMDSGSSCGEITGHSKVRLLFLCLVSCVEQLLSLSQPSLSDIKDHSEPSLGQTTILSTSIPLFPSNTTR